METKQMIGGAIMWGFIATYFIAWLASIIWAFGDARKKGKSGIFVVLLLLILPWPIGFISWLVFRPTTKLRRR